MTLENKEISLKIQQLETLCKLIVERKNEIIKEIDASTKKGFAILTNSQLQIKSRQLIDFEKIYEINRLKILNYKEQKKEG